MEPRTDHILVDNGVIFDGTRDQFRDCFFDNAYNDAIKDWCENEKWNLSINSVVILKFD